MLNFVRKSKYHQTAGNYSISGSRVRDKYRFLLWKIKPLELLGGFDSAAEAQQFANAIERKAA